ncbi:MAG: hypothetical protein LE169_03855, partial [Endomicrobium sp.]|nr:hypothetical protein [Endomicrobium sp.]
RVELRHELDTVGHYPKEVSTAAPYKKPENPFVSRKPIPIIPSSNPFGPPPPGDQPPSEKKIIIVYPPRSLVPSPRKQVKLVT